VAKIEARERARETEKPKNGLLFFILVFGALSVTNERTKRKIEHQAAKASINVSRETRGVVRASLPQLDERQGGRDEQGRTKNASNCILTALFVWDIMLLPGVGKKTQHRNPVRCVMYGSSFDRKQILVDLAVEVEGLVSLVSIRKAAKGYVKKAELLKAQQLELEEQGMVDGSIRLDGRGYYRLHLLMTETRTGEWLEMDWGKNKRIYLGKDEGPRDRAQAAIDRYVQWKEKGEEIVALHRELKTILNRVEWMLAALGLIE